MKQLLNYRHISQQKLNKKTQMWKNYYNNLV
jgi:hypothetical protein